MPKGSAVADVEAKLEKEYGNNKGAVYGTLNKIGLMHGNKPTAKGLKPAKGEAAPGETEAHAVKGTSRPARKTQSAPGHLKHMKDAGLI